MDDGGRCLLDVINDPLLLQSFLECGSDSFPKGHHNGDNSLSAATAGGTLLIGHHHDVVTSNSATSSPSTLLSLASLKPSLESMGFNCQVDKQSLMGHITVSSAVGTSVISPLPAVYPISATANRFSPSPQQLYSIKSPSQGSSPAQTMPPPSSPLQSPPTPRNSSPTVLLQPQTLPKGQQSYHPSQQPTIIPLSMHHHHHQQQQLPTRLSALSGHVVPTTSGVPSVVQIISPQPAAAPMVGRSAPTSVRSIQPKQPQQILPKPPKSAQVAKQVAPNPMATSPRAMGVSLNAPTNSPMVIGQSGQPGVFTGPQGTIVLNQFLPGVGHGPFVIQGNIGNMQGVQLTLRPTQPGHYTTSPTTAPQATAVTPSGPQNNATLIAALQAPSQHGPTILGQPKPPSLPAHHTIVFPGGLTGQNINLTSQGSVIHSPHPNQGILTQRPNIFLAPRMLGANHALQLQQIQTPQGPITIALAPSHTLSLQQLAGLQGPQLTSMPGMMGQGMFSNVALTRHQPSPVPVPSHSPFAAAKSIQEQPPHHQQQQQILVRPLQKPVTPQPPVVSQPETVTTTPVVEDRKPLSAMMKPSLNLAELLKEHGIVPETTPPSSPGATSAVSSETVESEATTPSGRDVNQETQHVQVGESAVSSTDRIELRTSVDVSPPVIQQPTVSSSVQDHPTLLSRLNSAPASEASSLVLGSMRSGTPPEVPHHLIPLTIRNNTYHLPPVTLSLASEIPRVGTTFVTAGLQQQRVNHVIVGLQPFCEQEAMAHQQQQPQVPDQTYVPTATSKLVSAPSMMAANPVLVKTASDLTQVSSYPSHNGSTTISTTAPTPPEFQSNPDVAKHQQALLVQLRPPCQAPFGSITTCTSRTIASPMGMQTAEKSSDNCKFSQDLSKTRQASTCSNFINVVNRPLPLLHHLAVDQNVVLRPDTSKPFSSCRDACTKLLHYHVYDSQVPTKEDLRKTDDLFEVVSQRLLERRQRMINKYRYLLLKESMKASPSSENVMLERMFIQEEIPSLKMYKKMVSEGKEKEMMSTPNVVSTKEIGQPEENEIKNDVSFRVAPCISPPRVPQPMPCECRTQPQSLKRDRTKSPCPSEDEASAEPSSKKCVVKLTVASPEESVHGSRESEEHKVNNSVFNHVVHEHEDMVSKIRKELNISPIDHHSEEEGQTDFEAHSGSLDFFEPPVTRSNSSCGSPFPYNPKSSSATGNLRYDFDVMDGQSEWSEAYGNQKLFMDADLFSDHGKLDQASENARTFMGGLRLASSRSGSLKINCIRSLEEGCGVNGEFLGSLDEDSEDDSGEVNAQVQTAIKSILDIDSVDNHSYYADGQLVSHVFGERQVKLLQDSRAADFDENLNPDMSGNSLESDAALDEAVRSILL